MTRNGLLEWVNRSYADNLISATHQIDGTVSVTNEFLVGEEHASRLREQDREMSIFDLRDRLKRVLARA